jgi:hypothetical protein
MEYRNPVFATEDKSRIDCEINHPEHGWIPFTCDPADTAPIFDTEALFNQMVPNAAAYVAPTPPSVEEIAAYNREIRDALLRESDWSQLPDVSDEITSAWVTYRQALRDITTHANWPNLSDSDWPTKPA